MAGRNDAFAAGHGGAGGTNENADKIAKVRAELDKGLITQEEHDSEVASLSSKPEEQTGSRQARPRAFAGVAEGKKVFVSDTGMILHPTEHKDYDLHDFEGKPVAAGTDPSSLVKPGEQLRKPSDTPASFTVRTLRAPIDPETGRADRSRAVPVSAERPVTGTGKLKALGIEPVPFPGNAPPYREIDPMTGTTNQVTPEQHQANAEWLEKSKTHAKQQRMLEAINMVGGKNTTPLLDPKDQAELGEQVARNTSAFPGKSSRELAARNGQVATKLLDHITALRGHRIFSSDSNDPDMAKALSHVLDAAQSHLTEGAGKLTVATTVRTASGEEGKEKNRQLIAEGIGHIREGHALLAHPLLKERIGALGTTGTNAVEVNPREMANDEAHAIANQRLGFQRQGKTPAKVNIAGATLDMRTDDGRTDAKTILDFIKSKSPDIVDHPISQQVSRKIRVAMAGGNKGTLRFRQSEKDHLRSIGLGHIIDSMEWGKNIQDATMEHATDQAGRKLYTDRRDNSGRQFTEDQVAQLGIHQHAIPVMRPASQEREGTENLGNPEASGNSAPSAETDQTVYAGGPKTVRTGPFASGTTSVEAPDLVDQQMFVKDPATNKTVPAFIHKETRKVIGKPTFDALSPEEQANHEPLTKKVPNPLAGQMATTQEQMVDGNGKPLYRHRETGELYTQDRINSERISMTKLAPVMRTQDTVVTRVKANKRAPITLAPQAIEAQKAREAAEKAAADAANQGAASTAGEEDTGETGPAPAPKAPKPTPKVPPVAKSASLQNRLRKGK